MTRNHPLCKIPRAMCSRSQPGRASRRAMTLLELLIVIAIMTLLLTAGMKLAQPAFQGRKVRESARQLNAVFAGAKARATERGRPFGVWFERTPGNLNQVLEVFQAEVPPPYIGDLVDARVNFSLDNNSTPANPNDDFWRVVFNPAQCATLFATQGSLVAVGETFGIKFDFRGRVYGATRLAQNDANLADDFRLAGSPPPAPGQGLKFQIYLPPRKSLVTPLDLVNGTAIDLSLSGLGATGTDFDGWNAPPSAGQPTPAPDPFPIIVMFAPAGNIDVVYSRGGVFTPVSEVHFLVGRNDTIAALDFNNPQGPPNPRDTRNLQDQDNLWVTVGHRTGTVTSTENYYNTLTPTVDVSRQFARSAQAKGGG